MSLELHEVSNTNKKAIDGQLAFGAIPEPQGEQSLPKKVKRKRARLDEIKMDFRVVELKDIQRQISLQDLLAPYSSADIIGFSYSLDFIEKCILPHVDYCRLILGADFLRVKKGMELANQFLRVEKSNAKAIQSHPKIMEAIKDGSLEIKTAVSIVDHRKYYLFRGESVDPLILDTSANPTRTGWDESHVESRNIVIGTEAYSVYSHEFDTAWKMAQDLPMEAVEVKVQDDGLDSYPTIAKIQHDGKDVVLFEALEVPKEITREEISYTADLQAVECSPVEKAAIKAKYDPSDEDGKTIIGKELIQQVKKFSPKKSSGNLQVKMEKKVQNYPALEIDYESDTLYQNHEVVPSPTKEEVARSGKKILKVYKNFDDFTGTKKEIEQTKFMWYKVMNYMFASIFFAEVRTKEFEVGKTRDALPLYAVIYSPKSSAGKSFMTNAIIKMMLGIRGSQADWGKAIKDANSIGKRTYYELLEELQKKISRSPIVVDEAEVIITGPSKKYVSDYNFKQSDKCEKNYRITQPCILFNINGTDALNDDVGRKRVAHFVFTTSLSSKIDVCSYGNQSEQLLQELDTNFYHRYCEIMIKRIQSELETLSQKDVNYYIDVLKISSEAILQVFQEAGLSIPSFIKPLSWRKDYCKDAKYHSEAALKEIEYIIQNNPDDVIIDNEYVSLYLQNKEYRGQNKKVQDWKNVLPDDLRIEELPSSDRPEYTKIHLLRAELEYELGYSLQPEKKHHFLPSFSKRKRKEK